MMLTPNPGIGAVVAAAVLATGSFGGPFVLAAERKPLSVSSSATATAHATIQSVDAESRHVTVKTASGEVVALKVPEGSDNFKQLKPGDALTVTYHVETELLLTPNGQSAPKDADALIAARAAKGELPAGAVANHVVVTGAVLGVDQANRTLKIVSPKGGEVHRIKVTTTDGKALLPHIKVGDRVTAYVTEALLVSTKPG